LLAIAHLIGLHWGFSSKESICTKQKTRVLSLGQEVPLEKGMATHSSILTMGNPMDRGAWQATVHGVAKELVTT